MLKNIGQIRGEYMSNIEEYEITPVDMKELKKDISKSRGSIKNIIRMLAKVACIILLPLTAFIRFVFHAIGGAIKILISIIGGFFTIGGVITFFNFLQNEADLFIVIFSFLVGFICFILSGCVDAIVECLIAINKEMIKFIKSRI